MPRFIEIEGVRKVYDLEKKKSVEIPVRNLINVEDIVYISPPKSLVSTLDIDAGVMEIEEETLIQIRGHKRLIVVQYSYKRIVEAIQAVMQVENAILNVGSMKFGSKA